jgi:hypothetical protein
VGRKKKPNIPITTTVHGIAAGESEVMFVFGFNIFHITKATNIVLLEPRC